MAPITVGVGKNSDFRPTFHYTPQK